MKSRNRVFTGGHHTSSTGTNILPGDEDFISPEDDDEDLLLSGTQDAHRWGEETISPSQRVPAGPFPFEQFGVNQWRKSKRTFFVIVLAALIGFSLLVLCFRTTISIARLRQKGIPPGLYSRDGVLYVGEKTPFMIKGLSWYGMEEPAVMPAGLDKVSVSEIFEFTRNFGFNAIRLPMSVENLVKNPLGHTVAFKNPELTGLSYIDIIKALVKKAAEHDVLILLDIHRLQSHEVKSGGLWYSDKVSEDRLIYVWKVLCENLKDEWNILGADIYNEPWDAVWNSEDKSRDWKPASERIGNSIHETCPSWTIFIEGIGNRESSMNTSVFWSENLRDIQNAPPELKLKSKVVLSPHVYGPSVFKQTYFEDDTFPDNMPDIWNNHFGESSRVSGLATVVGEWGGRFVGKDKEWQLKFYRYLLEKKVPFFYWCLNPDSADTGGLVHDDWQTPENNRLSMLEDAPSTDVGDHLDDFQFWRNWRV